MSGYSLEKIPFVLIRPKFVLQLLVLVREDLEVEITMMLCDKSQPRFLLYLFSRDGQRTLEDIDQHLAHSKSFGLNEFTSLA